VIANLSAPNGWIDRFKSATMFTELLPGALIQKLQETGKITDLQKT
jgi:hypothetical protein